MENKCNNFSSLTPWHKVKAKKSDLQVLDHVSVVSQLPFIMRMS